jgi:hypothetical protein
MSGAIRFAEHARGRPGRSIEFRFPVARRIRLAAAGIGVSTVQQEI